VQVHTDLSSFPLLEFPVVTTGTFDGGHLGHRKILNRLRSLADQHRGETVVITFNPHPRLVLAPEAERPKLLLTLPEKIERLEVLGIDHLLVINFTKEFSLLSSDNFIKQILVNTIHTRKLVIGYDHHFGKDREGSFENLVKSGPLYGFDVEEIPALDVNNVNISSTRIRNAIKLGDIQTANAFLGYSYFFSGKVVKGYQNGRLIGFPTANMDMIGTDKLLPANGVYAVLVSDGEKLFKGMMNIGVRPTVHQQGNLSVEVHLFDFNGELYNQTLRISLCARIRDEKRFDSIDALRQQLTHDKQVAHDLLQ